MSALCITDVRRSPHEGMPDQGKDVLKTDDLNALPGPLLARLLGGGEYEIIDIEPQIATARINVGGLSQVVEFIEITNLTDLDGITHDADDFWID